MRVPGEGGAAHEIGAGRWRARAALPALLCALGGGAISCFGDCWPTTSPPEPPPAPPTLRPRYVLVRAGSQTLPAVLAETGTVRVRLLADTLVFTITTPDTSRGTYTETVVIGTRDASGVETVSRTVSPTREWTRPPNASLLLPAFGAGGAVLQANASPFEAFTAPGAATTPQLSVFTTDGRTFLFEAR